MRRQKGVSFVLACILMAVQIVPALNVSAAKEDKLEVVAQYDMSHSNGKLTDKSGNGNDAVLTGIQDADFAKDGSADVLKFTGNKEKYVTLPAGLIETENFTVEAEFLADKTGTSGENSWLFCIGTKVASWPNVNNYAFFCPAQGNNNNNAQGKVRAGIKDASNEQLLPQDKQVKTGEYNTMVYAFENGTVTVSLNGEVIGTMDTGYSIQSIIKNGTDGTALGYIGKSLYSPDPAFSGSLKSFTIKAEKKDISDTGVLAEAKKSLNIPYDTTDRPVYGNITLPEKTDNGVAVTWETSHPDIVDVEAHDNDGYDGTPAGTVTRPAEDTDVTMTATLKSGEETDTKTFTFTVKKAAEPLTSEDYTDYFFAYFAGEAYNDGEQIYFAASRDGLTWKDLNDNNPILTSTLGDKGVRDPYIIRSPEGDKFYMIATDLRIKNGKGWGAAQTAGSQSLMVWESTDLVNWSDQRMVEVSASIQSGCTWAPEATYDPVTGEYIVYWASKVAADNYGKQRLYYCKTRDFYTFTEPKVWIEDKTESCIDTTVIYEKDEKMFYRYTKNEGGAANSFGAKTKTIFIEKSPTLLGEWTHIPSDTLNANQWVEGPTIFKFNSEDTEGDKWCLLVDDFGGRGYYPLVTDDLSTGVFESPQGYRMPSRARHGTPIPVTAAEYAAVMAKWGSDAPVNNEEEQIAPVLSYDFESEEGTKITDTTGNNHDGTIYGNAKIQSDEAAGSKVLYLDGSTDTYAAFPQGFFDGRNKFSVSMDMKAETLNGNFFAFAIGQNNNKYLFMRPNNDGSLKSVITTGSYGSEKGFTEGKGTVAQNKWIHLTLIMDGVNMKLYVDDKLIGENKNVGNEIADLGRNVLAYLGKSFYSEDGYFKGAFDNIKIYNRAVRESELKGAVLGDKRELRKLLKECDALDKKLYTEESWKEFEKAVEAAKAVDENLDALEKEVEDAVKALTKAKEQLVRRVPDRPFVDVSRADGDWYYDAVYYNYDRKIMKGVNESHFEPLSNLARAQFAVILHNMEGNPSAAYEPKFRDVEDKQWYTEAIMWASSKEIVTGYTDGSETFGWGDNILREQMAVMMYRYAKNFKGYDVSDSTDFDNFADASQVSEYAKEAMKWAVGAGIITGKENGTKLDPQGDALRAECAIIIERFLQKYKD